MFKEMFNKTNKPKVISLIITLIVIITAEIALTVSIPVWRSYFYNILQLKQQSLFMTSLIYFFVLMTSLGFVQGVKVWVGQLVSFKFREAGSKILLKSWAKNPVQVTNYTQAQTEALRNSTELFLGVAVESIISLAIVVSLILANIHNMPILIASLVYTIGVSILAILFNKPLITTNAAWQAAEGRYREALSDIANGNGDFSSKNKFIELVHSYYTYVRIVMYYTLFSGVKSSVASIVPYILLATPYFTGTITLGAFMAGVATFELITINATILVILYPKLAAARASHNIVNNFYKEVNQ